jgi:hypothetical protein
MSKHPQISKSKTLEVPIIITSPTNDPNHDTFEYQQSPTTPNRFKLDKALSLDSHKMSYQNSLDSSSCSINNSLNSTESLSNNSIHQFQFFHQKFLTPPPIINSETTENMSAVFKTNQN